jgi:S1-C subfamily serine protease
VLIGDILVALDGKPVADTDDVQALLDPERVGKTIAATVIRGGEVAALTVTVGERPQRGE